MAFDFQVSSEYIKHLQTHAPTHSFPLLGVFDGETHKAVPSGPCDDSLQDPLLHTGPFLLGQRGLLLPS